MSIFSQVSTVDTDKPLAILIWSSGALDFIYSPFDTPKGPDGVIFLSDRR